MLLVGIFVVITLVGRGGRARVAAAAEPGGLGHRRRWACSARPRWSSRRCSPQARPRRAARRRSSPGSSRSAGCTASGLRARGRGTEAACRGAPCCVAGRAAVGLGALASAGGGVLLARSVQGRARRRHRAARPGDVRRAGHAGARGRGVPAAGHADVPHRQQRLLPDRHGAAGPDAVGGGLEPARARDGRPRAHAELRRPGRTARSSSAPITMTCVSNPIGGNLVSTANFIGVPLRDVLLEAGVAPGADQLFCTSSDGWYTGTPMATVLEPDRGALLAIGMNGEALPPRARVPGAHGRAGPLRVRVGHEVVGRPRGHHVRRPRQAGLLAAARLVAARADQDDVADRQPGGLRDRSPRTP